jgi:oligopeptide/dipeptide ABC transporter ATP-binding protein
MIFISHQLSVVSYLADRIAVMYLGRIVELGPTASVFEDPRHPYTEALLGAQAGRHRRGPRDQPVLAGEPPSGYAIGAGCRFRTRCVSAQGICAEVDPPPVSVTPEHESWCHFATAKRDRPQQTMRTGEAV